MSPKVVVFLALLAVAFAERPYVGLRIPHLPLISSSPQVVGGGEAPEHAYSHIVSLQWGITSRLLQHFCAGSILNPQWIITAGHCVQAVPSLGRFVVKAGKHDITQSESTEQASEVERSFVHESYKGGVGPYDIALLKLKSPLELTDAVQAVKLPPSESEPTGNANLCGWGSTSTSAIPRMPTKLQHAELPYVDRTTCYDAVLKLTGSSPVHETNVCTGPLTGGKSACSGDSGGPLTSGSGQDRILTGIVSWGIIPCGTAGAPSVYTRVSKFNSWIEQKMQFY